MMQIDKESDTWKVIDKWINKSLAQTQKDNMERLSNESTTFIRGYYKALKDLQALSTQKQMEEITLSDYT